MGTTTYIEREGTHYVVVRVKFVDLYAKQTPRAAIKENARRANKSDDKTVTNGYFARENFLSARAQIM